MGRFLDADQAKEFYDRAGSKMSSQDFYEDRAVDDLIAHSAFESASRVFELGFGRGQLAEKLLRFHLKSSAKYYGVDISSTMLGFARERLHPYDSQVTLSHTDGILKFNFPDSAFDRFITTFVLDILSPGYHDSIA